MASGPETTEPSFRLRVLRRVVLAIALAVIVGGIANGYRATSPVLAWQMFPEASVWQAEIVRVTTDGSRIDIRDPWPGGYEWAALVDARGIGSPFAERPASYGIDVTLDTLQHALDWVATNTPDDGDTAFLEAIVRYRRNSDVADTVVLRSVPRRP